MQRLATLSVLVVALDLLAFAGRAHGLQEFVIPPQLLPASPEPHLVFGAPITTSFNSMLEMDFADLQGDGFADVIARAPTGQLVRAFGVGDGTFGAAVALPGTSDYDTVTLADMNGDGRPDVLGGAPGKSFKVALVSGAGGVSAPTIYALAGTQPGAEIDVSVADADGDGDLDAALATGKWVGTLVGYVALYVNDGTSALTSMVLDDHQHGYPVQARPADFNGDQLPDVLASSAVPGGASHVVFLGQPGGGFGESAAIGISWQPSFACVADLDDDGVPDLAVPAQNSYQTWLGDGDGTFTFLQSVPVGFASTGLMAADMDQDGHLDLVSPSGNGGKFHVMKGAGDGTSSLHAGASVVPGEHTLRSPGVADVNGDGRLDLTAGQDLYFGQASKAVAVLNRTYPAGGPVESWGGALEGVNGYPVAIASGTFLPGSPMTLDVFLGKPFANPWLIAGLDAIFAPIKGGVLVPEPALLFGPLSLDSKGSLNLPAVWPVGLPVGQSLNFQFWIPDTLFGKPFSASAGVHVEQP